MVVCLYDHLAYMGRFSYWVDRAGRSAGGFSMDRLGVFAAPCFNITRPGFSCLSIACLALCVLFLMYCVSCLVRLALPSLHLCVVLHVLCVLHSMCFLTYCASFCF